MNPEELKAIIEMIGGLGASTMNGFIAYLAFKILATVISSSVAVFGLTIIYKLGKHIVNTVHNNLFTVNVLRQLQSICGIHLSTYLSHRDANELLGKVKEMKND